MNPARLESQVARILPAAVFSIGGSAVRPPLETGAEELAEGKDPEKDVAVPTEVPDGKIPPVDAVGKIAVG